MKKLNIEYINILQQFSGVLKKDRYLVLGSAATLSYTAKLGYERQMNDLDIIADYREAMKIKQKLIKSGFKQGTFINKRMPFYSKLMKRSESFYLRFSKDTINVEVLSTEFKAMIGHLKFDLYPNVWVEVPMNAVRETKLGNAKFTSLDVNLVWAIKQFLNNTLGKVMHYKGVQRKQDLSELRKRVDLEKAKNLLLKCKIGYKSINFHVPLFLLT